MTGRDLPAGFEGPANSVRLRAASGSPPTWAWAGDAPRRPRDRTTVKRPKSIPQRDSEGCVARTARAKCGPHSSRAGTNSPTDCVRVGRKARVEIGRIPAGAAVEGISFEIALPGRLRAAWLPSLCQVLGNDLGWFAAQSAAPRWTPVEFAGNSQGCAGPASPSVS